jgi:UDP-N-acetylmuramate--alanine ligase
MKYHFIGIGGIGMSGIAKVLLEKGNKVSGSDLAENRQTEELKRIGAEIFHGHLAENLTTDVDFVVVSSAIKPDNPEIVQAKKLGITILNRSELLNEVITKDHKAIAVTGTHGKTTTSSMVASILEAAGFEPTAVIGAEVNALSGNAKAGQGEFSVAEVCEYKRAFLDIFPHAAVITNIEEDHLDCYKDINDIVSAFADFVTHIDTDGFLVIYGEDRNIDNAIKNFKGRTIRYGQSYQNDWYLEDVNITGHETSFSVISDGNRLDRFKIIIPGFHNVLNALAAIVVTKTIGVPTSAIKDVLSKFVGAERRFQLKGEKGGVIFVDDYGHHPTEIMATLAGEENFIQTKRSLLFSNLTNIVEQDFCLKTFLSHSQTLIWF